MIVRDVDICIIVTDCDVYTWGKCARGRLGRPMDTRLPKQVHFGGAYEPFTVTSISCSHGTTLLAAKRKLIMHERQHQLSRPGIMPLFWIDMVVCLYRITVWSRIICRSVLTEGIVVKFE